MSPPRVVSLSPSSTEVVCALGCGEWLVGRSHACDHPEWVRKLPAVTRPIPGITADAAASADAPVAGVDTAALAALRPDLIVTPVECSTLADLWREFRRIADALGVPERGLQLVTRLSGRMRAIESRAATLGPRPRIVFIECLEPLAAVGRWIPELVTLAGGENLFGIPGAPPPRVGWDALRAADPDVLWNAPRGWDLARARAGIGTVAARPGWSGLGAVRTARVFVGDGHSLFHRPGPRVMESLEALAEALHPAAYRFGHEGRGWERHVAGAAEARA
jgi:iron complex transport system substrate-binding protein